MALAVAVAAAILVLYTVWQFRNLRLWATPDATRQLPHAQPSLSVIVPFRNEAGRLPALLKSLYAQDYAGQWEIILVDDHSDDDGGTALHVPAGIRLRLLRLAEHPDYLHGPAYKKAAIALGVDRSEGEIIVTTDADCQWPPEGLSTLAGRFADGADVVLGTVLIEPVTDLCSAFQALDLAGYQLLTRASVRADEPTLANGAHFAFTKQAFLEVGGYAGVDHLPSGDDVLLLHKFMRDGGYLIRHAGGPGEVVLTQPVSGWRSLWKQRLRWAGKAGNYASPALTFAQALAFATSLTVVGGLLLGFIRPAFAGIALAVWTGKAGVDYLLLDRFCRYYGRTGWMRYYWPVQAVYPFFLVAVGVAALAGARTDWKGRR